MLIIIGFELILGVVMMVSGIRNSFQSIKLFSKQKKNKNKEFKLFQLIMGNFV